MQGLINLFAVSENPSLLEGLEKLPLNENGIYIYSSTCNFHLPFKHLQKRYALHGNNCVLFIDNLTISNTATTQLLGENKAISNNKGTKLLFTPAVMMENI